MVFDKAGLATRLGEVALLPLDLVALDSQDREVGLMQMPFGSADLSIFLRSRPPTKHDDELEEALMALVENNLTCRIHQINRSENEAGLRIFHNDLIVMARGWMKRDTTP